MDIFLTKFLLISSILLIFSILLSKSSLKFGVPVLVLLIFIGMLAGSEGILGISFENYELGYSFSLVSLTLIIFAGGFGQKLQDVKPIAIRGTILSTVGILLTTSFVAVFVKCVSSFSWIEALLLGSILSATDAPAVFSSLKDSKAQILRPIRTLIEFESASNDPVAYFLVATLCGIYGQKISVNATLGVHVIFNFFVGIAFGLTLAKLYVVINNQLELLYKGLYPVLALAFVFLCYALATYFEGNGFLAVYIFGLYIGNTKIVHKKSIFDFYDGLSWLSQIGMFLILGLLVFPSRLFEISPFAIFVSLFLALIARPLSTYICLYKSRFNFKEQSFIAWAGLKGASPIVFATFAAHTIGDKALIIFDIVFFTVLFSAVLQGSSLRFFARKIEILFQSIEDQEFPINEELIRNSKQGVLSYFLRSEDAANGKAIYEIFFPKGSLVLFIKRDGTIIIPNGKTILKEHDQLLLVSDSKDDLVIALERIKHQYQEAEIMTSA